MNLIPCDQGCQHQKEGYCTLDNISQLTNYEPDAHCGYFTAPEVGTMVGYISGVPRSDNSEGFGNI